MLICLGIVSVQLIGTLIWLIVDPPGTTIQFPTRIEAVLTCKVCLYLKGRRMQATTSHLLISLLYNIFLILACTIYAFKTRKIPENFNETRLIGFTMYSTSILWLSFGPIYFATQNNFRASLSSPLSSSPLSDPNHEFVYVYRPLGHCGPRLFLRSEGLHCPLATL